MTEPQVLSSPWVRNLEKQRMRRKHIVLYGNIHDQCLWRGSYYSVNNFLREYFNGVGCDIVVEYDPIDGLSFANHTLRSAYHGLVRRGLDQRNEELEPPTTPEALPAEPPAAAAPTPGRRIPGATASPSGPVTRRIAPEEAFGDMRFALRQAETSIVAIVNLADMLTTDASRYTSDERHALIQLHKCTSEAAVVSQGRCRGFRNTLVILANDLKRVPDWFYLNDPNVEIVHVERPNQEERREFALNRIRPSGNFQGFFGGDKISAEKQAPQAPSELELLAAEFADLTEGLQTLDLNAMRFTSHQAEIPIQRHQVRRLVDFFKFDLRDDPWEKLDAGRIQQAAASLATSVIGQPKAVDAVVRMLISARVGINQSSTGSSSAPKGVFFFVGPTGVGKTELAKAVTKLVFGDERAFARFDMSEYKEEHAAEKLAGAPPGFVGYDEGGLLTNRVIQRPHSILLFDEIEKAHPRVLDKFLQILEDGRLTDGKGQTAYFNQTAIIFTSNIGASDLTDSNGQIVRNGIMGLVRNGGESTMPYSQVEAHFKEEVQWYFASRISRVELLNRLGDNVVVFDILRPEFIRQIGQKFVRLLAGNAAEKYQLTIEVGDSWYKFLQDQMVQMNNLLYGGRRIRSLTATYLQDPLNSWIFTRMPDLAGLRNRTLTLEIRNGVFEVSNNRPS